MLSNIKKLASEKGMSILQLEKQCGLSNGSIYHWDEIAPAYDKVLKVAKALGVTVEDLVNQGGD